MTSQPEYPVAYASKPHDAHWTNDTVTWEEILEWTNKPAHRKECGNYILATLSTTEKVHSGARGPCTDVHRDNRSVARRSAVLALDIDAPDDGFDLAVEVLLKPYTYVMHTTHSSTPSEPRYRLLVQADRDMAPDEYVEATQALAAKLGKDQFDKGSFEVARFMFKPAARKPEWYDRWENYGVPVPVDELLEDFDRDLSEKPLPPPSRNKRDPFELEDPIGLFNRAYVDWDLLIDTFHLPYDKVSDDRYQLRGSVSEAGMGPIGDAPGLVFSHHSNDPAFGKACSAFDLVRLHWFGELDEAVKPGTPVNKLPSHTQMCDVASQDVRVINEKFNEQVADFGPVDVDGATADSSWKSKLKLTRQGRFEDVIKNWDLIKKHDRAFSRLYYNVLTMSPELSGDLPWRRITPLSRGFDAGDYANLRFHIEREYHFRPAKEFVEALVVTKATESRLSPIYDYLEQLKWDGIERVETCLPGAIDTRYTRLVARKVLAAAVARVYEPGVKWDHTLVLHGPEGFGKSMWIERMASVGLPERRTYHYTLGPINSKDTLLGMHMSWVVVADEGHSLRKSDNDSLKEFLTRTNDVFRMPYDRDTVVHPRQCVIWSTTNDDTFLRRQEGNRRFLMIRCLERFDIDAMTTDLVDQLWAEAVTMYKAGERLYLTDDESRLAELERDPFVEEDTTAGVLEEFLERGVPDDWWLKSPEARRDWVEALGQGFASEGSMIQERTCSRQLWHEALGQRLQPRKTDLLEITESVKSLGWISSGHAHFPGYGTQTVFIRKGDLL